MAIRPNLEVLPTAPAVQPRLSSASPGRPIKPLISIKKHRKITFAVIMVMICLGLPVAWFKGAAQYASSAVIHVSPRFLKNLEGDKELEFQSNSQYRQYVEHQVRTINRFDIVEEALESLGEKRHEFWQTEAETDQEAVERLMDALNIRAVRDTYLITIMLESERTDGLADLINAVIAAYLAKAKTEEVYASDERIANLEAQRGDLVQSIMDKSKRRLEITQQLGVTTFDENTVNPYDKLIVASQDALHAAERDLIVAEEALSSYLSGQSSAGVTLLEADAAAVIAQDPGLNSLKANLNLRRSKLVTKLTGLSRRHPGRRGIETEISDIDAKLKSAETEILDYTKASLLEQRRATAIQAGRIAEKLRQEIEEQRSNASWYATLYGEAVNLGDEANRARSRLESIEDRIDFLTLESQAPGFVRLVTAARKPLKPFKGGRKKLFIVFIVLGIAFGLAAPVAIDFLDTRIVAPGDAEKLLGFPPVGWFVEHEPDGEQVFVADQMRRLAIALSRDWRKRQTRTVALTSVQPGGGTTTLALELGRELTVLGVSTLVVETNSLNPDPRYLVDGRDPAGLAAAVVGAIHLKHLVMPATDEMPYRMPMGETPEIRHLALGSAFRDFQKSVVNSFDMVIFDSPPILRSADAELLADTCDATLLVIEAMSVRKGEVKRAARILEKVAPPAVGSIVNRIPVFDSSSYLKPLITEFNERDTPRMPMPKEQLEPISKRSEAHVRPASIRSS